MTSLILILTTFATTTSAKPFTLQVIDEATGRGVPLVELRTTSSLRLWTDSAGIVAFDEPGLMNQRVWFGVSSPGYEITPDGFGIRGRAFEVKPGGSATIKIRRTQIAERLYRVTGSGIYRDSLLLDRKVPIREPLLNAQITGQDSVLNAVYRGKLFWVWGDSNRPSYPLGNFQVTAATSLLPGKGGLSPAQGVDLSYFVDDKGFAKQMAPMPGEGPTWITSLFVLPDEEKRERLIASYVKIKPPLTVYARGLATFNDDKEIFEKLCSFDVNAPARPEGHSFVHEGYLYFASPYPFTRVRATLEDVRDPKKYESFTREGWKKNASPRAAKSIPLQDVHSGKRVVAHGGSVYWNEHRKRWIMIAVEAGGKASYLGEVWYAEADEPTGPWIYAVQVATHPRYSFYNPKQHPIFDEKNGRFVYFEGTYVNTFSGNPESTPRYDYNQLAYRLDLADDRLALPVAVRQNDKITFFALDRAVKGTIPLKVGASTFHALPATKKPPTTIPLYGEAGNYRLKPNGDEKPTARVWRNPDSE